MRVDVPDGAPVIGRVPVRNIWFLFLHAADLARFLGRFGAEVEAAPDLPDLIARLLCEAVEARLRRNLSRGYVEAQADLPRVRGGIDLVRTETRGLLLKGQVACRFAEHTLDTPRNRLVRAALERLAGHLTDRTRAGACRALAARLAAAGVGTAVPALMVVAADRIARHEADDALMLALARLALDPDLPTEAAGSRMLPRADREEQFVRRLFERAIGNFYAGALSRAAGWRVMPGRRLDWQASAASAGIAALLPGMVTDILIENGRLGRRIIVDTKFTGALGRSRWGTPTLRSGHLYQLHTYLTSQERADDPLSRASEGLLLYPVIDRPVDERVTLGTHPLRFATVDLSASNDAIAARLSALILAPVTSPPSGVAG